MFSFASLLYVIVRAVSLFLLSSNFLFNSSRVVTTSPFVSGVEGVSVPPDVEPPDVEPPDVEPPGVVVPPEVESSGFVD